MKRKVTKAGPASLVISLPSKWARKYNIKKGDEVDVEELDKKLVIHVYENQKQKNTITKIIPNLDKFMYRQITQLYIQGYNEIIVKFHDNRILEKIEFIVQQLIGFEIVNIDKKSIVIKNISSELEEEFDTILRRLFLIVLLMGERCLDYLTDKSKNELMKNSETEKISNKYTYFCERILVNKSNTSSKIFNSYAIVWTLEQVADRFLDITNMILSDSKITEKTLNDLKEIIELYRKYYELYYEPSKSKLNYVKEKHFEIKDRIVDELKKHNPPLYFHFSALLVFVEHMAQITF